MILAQGSGDFNSSNLNLSNPPRRDVAILPDSGYLVLAFKTDNPVSGSLSPTFCKHNS